MFSDGWGAFGLDADGLGFADTQTENTDTIQQGDMVSIGEDDNINLLEQEY